MATRKAPAGPAENEFKPTDPDSEVPTEELSPPDPDGLKRYIVQTDMVTVPVGRNRENGKLKHARVPFGGLVHGAPGSETIESLVQLGALREVKNAAEAAKYRDPRYRQSARAASLASGAPDDPVAQPKAEFLPVAAENPDQAPGRLGDPDIADPDLGDE